MSPTKRIAVTRRKQYSGRGAHTWGCASEPDTGGGRPGGRRAEDAPRPRPAPVAPPTPPAGARRAGRGAALGPARHAAAARCSALWAVARAAGPGAAAVHHRRADRAAAQPVRDVAAARSASRAAWRWRPSSSCSSLALAGLGVLLADPVANQVSSFRDNVPGIVDDANAVARRPAELARPQRHRRPGLKSPAETALESLGDRVAAGSGELVAFTRDALLRLVEAVDRGDPDPRPLGLHAALRRADRRAGARDRAAAATARPRTTSRRASRAPCSATCAASCCSR